MHVLPIETLYQIALSLSFEELLNFCQINIQAAQICQTEYFWQKKLQQDYPEVISIIPDHITSKEAYFKLASGQIRPIPVYYKGQMIDLIWPAPELSGLDLIHQIEQKFPQKTLFYITVVDLKGKNYHLLSSETEIGEDWKHILKLNVIVY